jgi:hypothetical protein
MTDVFGEYVTGRDGGISSFRGAQAMTRISELYARYHGLLLHLAVDAAGGHNWKSRLQEIFRQFDNDTRHLTPSESRLTRQELAAQIEQEALRFSDPDKRAVLTIALKRFDST